MKKEAPVPKTTFIVSGLDTAAWATIEKYPVEKARLLALLVEKIVRGEK